MLKKYKPGYLKTNSSQAKAAKKKALLFLALRS
jgi:hypothetical protein